MSEKAGSAGDLGSHALLGGAASDGAATRREARTPSAAPDAGPSPAAAGQARAILAGYLGVIAYAGLVFLGAWKLVYWQGILYLVLALVGTTVSHLLMPAGSRLALDRAREVGAGERWDKQLLGVYFLVTVVIFVVAGLDSGRFGWSGAVPPAVNVAGAMLMVTGQMIFAVAKSQNEFFSSTVRIQVERGHRVCTTGLYRFVRHPGYLGLMISLLAFPLVMGSYWAFVPTLVAAVLLVVRTVLEDRLLMRELEGYADYAARTALAPVPGRLLASARSAMGGRERGAQSCSKTATLGRSRWSRWTFRISAKGRKPRAS